MTGRQFRVDRGGTFTDTVARRPDVRLLTHKLLSDSPARSADAAVKGVRTLLGGSCEPVGTVRYAETLRLVTEALYPSRNPKSNLAGLRPRIAAAQKGVDEVGRMIEDFGLDVVQAYMRHVQDNTEEAVRRIIDASDDGDYTYESDSGAVIRVSVRVDRENRAATIDFTGTSTRLPTDFNAPFTVVGAAVLYVFRTLVADDIPLDDGCLRPLDIVVPPGSLLSAEPPAAVVQTQMTNSRLTDPEVLEWRLPVRLGEFAVRRGSGGAGRWRGGDGAVRRIRFLEPMTVSMLSRHRRVRPYGRAGGEPGALGANRVERADATVTELGGGDSADVVTGDVLVIETPGGGGYGPPSPDPHQAGEEIDDLRAF